MRVCVFMCVWGGVINSVIWTHYVRYVVKLSRQIKKLRCCGEALQTSPPGGAW